MIAVAAREAGARPLDRGAALPVRTWAGGDFRDFGDEPTRLLIAGAAVTGKAGSVDWWRCPYPLESVLAALAEALRYARGGVTASGTR